MEGGGFEGEFGTPCTRMKIKQKLTTTDTSKLSGVTERQIAIIEVIGLAAKTLERYTNVAFSKGESL